MYCKEPLSLIACHVIATKLTDKQIRRGIFHSVPELIQAIKNFVKVDSNDSVPFVWTASVQSIMEKINRCKAIYATQH